jgi:hypothetical protein
MNAPEKRLEFIKDVIRLGVEGGLDEWASYTAFTYELGEVRLVDEDKTSFKIGLAKVDKALKEIIDNPEIQMDEEFLKSIFIDNRNNEVCEIDGEIAGKILQVCCYGNVVE